MSPRSFFSSVTRGCYPCIGLYWITRFNVTTTSSTTFSRFLISKPTNDSIRDNPSQPEPSQHNIGRRESGDISRHLGCNQYTHGSQSCNQNASRYVNEEAVDYDANLELIETTKKRSSLYNVTPSERIAQVVQPMALSAHQIQMQKHLNQLEWERVLVYIRGFNAHASIVCRERRFVNDGGRAAIQHFVDTLFVAC